MSELPTQTTNRKATLKRLIKDLHEGADPQRAREQSAALLRTLSPTEIAQIEGELVREGMPRQELQRLCDVHLAMFKESLEREETPPPSDHPVQILMKEHELLLELTAELRSRAKELQSAPDAGSAVATMERLRQIAEELRASQSHYVREENVLFPYLERHGIVEPPAVMWSEHDRVRALEKNLYQTLEMDEGSPLQGLGKRLEAVAESLGALLASHFYKENNILFRAALNVITEPEWIEVAREFRDLGYWQIVPQAPAEPVEEAEAAGPAVELDGAVVFETGSLPLAALETILNSLPVDLTFVDAEDTVRYFSQTKERIFPRTTAIIGRRVQQCHPEKSVHLVNQILEDFRKNRRDTAEFWIQSAGHFILINYYAIRRDGQYLGCLEVTQEATGIRQLEGEKRLL